MNESIEFTRQVWAGGRNLCIISAYVYWKASECRRMRTKDGEPWDVPRFRDQADAQNQQELTLKWPEREGDPRESGVPEDRTRMLFREGRVITFVSCSLKDEKNKN